MEQTHVQSVQPCGHNCIEWYIWADTPREPTYRAGKSIQWKHHFHSEVRSWTEQTIKNTTNEKLFDIFMNITSVFFYTVMTQTHTHTLTHCPPHKWYDQQHLRKGVNIMKVSLTVRIHSEKNLRNVMNSWTYHYEFTFSRTQLQNARAHARTHTEKL